MQDQIKSLPKKYIQYTDENKKDRRKVYVALDEVLEIVNRHTDYPLPNDFNMIYKMSAYEFEENALKNIHNKYRK